jgi:hypothetical protein
VSLQFEKRGHCCVLCFHSTGASLSLKVAKWALFLVGWSLCDSLQKFILNRLSRNNSGETAFERQPATPYLFGKVVSRLEMQSRGTLAPPARFVAERVLRKLGPTLFPVLPWEQTSDGRAKTNAYDRCCRKSLRFALISLICTRRCRGCSGCSGRLVCP